MPNVCPDPGFEAGSLTWQYSAGAARDPASIVGGPHSGSWAGRIPQTPGPLGGWQQGHVAQIGLPAIPGRPVDLALWVNGDAALGRTGLRLEVDPGDGSLVTLSLPSAPAGWSRWTPGTFTALGAAVSVTVTLDPFLPGASIWFVDDVEVVVPTPTTIEELSPVAKYEANKAALDVLAGISGPEDGFRIDLGGRVYTTWALPEDGNVELPFAVMPLQNEGESLEYEGRTVVATWRMTVAGYFRDDRDAADTPLNTPAFKAAADFRDDLLLAFMADPTLGRTVTRCELVSVNSIAGVLPDARYAEVICVLSFEQRLALQDLKAIA